MRQKSRHAVGPRGGWTDGGVRPQDGQADGGWGSARCGRCEFAKFIEFSRHCFDLIYNAGDTGGQFVKMYLISAVWSNNFMGGGGFKVIRSRLAILARRGDARIAARGAAATTPPMAGLYHTGTAAAWGAGIGD